jgi:hypothetical protein
MEDEARRTYVADYLDKNGRSVVISNIPMKVTMLCSDQSVNGLYLVPLQFTNVH